ncbi:MAG: zinc-dependent peptidase [Desertifilum sp. SIO1I2]|nr:zinc-dependent peptidase [Desertifilum sp. SIO1I2]
MRQTLIVLLAISIIVLCIFAFPVLKRWQRQRIKRRCFPPLWQAIVENNVAMYWALTPQERRRLQGHIQVFLSEKQFIGCQGLQVTLEMKLTIAAVSCLLLLNERGTYFPKLQSILIYPNTYFVKEVTSNDGYIMEETQVARLGESWSRDQLVLSWEQVQRDTQNWKDGHNVILHEFAHQLDQEDGRAEGVPILLQKLDYEIWSKVMLREYQNLCINVEKGMKTTLDYYGATNPAEFFAVATETFFEKPRQLRKKHPELYEQLQHYYQLDPAQWI